MTIAASTVSITGCRAEARQMSSEMFYHMRQWAPLCHAATPAVPVGTGSCHWSAMQEVAPVHSPRFTVYFHGLGFTAQACGCSLALRAFMMEKLKIRSHCKGVVMAVALCNRCLTSSPSCLCCRPSSPGHPGRGGPYERCYKWDPDGAGRGCAGAPVLSH